MQPENVRSQPQNQARAVERSLTCKRFCQNNLSQNTIILPDLKFESGYSTTRSYVVKDILNYFRNQQIKLLLKEDLKVTTSQISGLTRILSQSFKLNKVK